MGCKAGNPFYSLGSEQSALSLPGQSRRRTEEKASEGVQKKESGKYDDRADWSLSRPAACLVIIARRVGLGDRRLPRLC